MLSAPARCSCSLLLVPKVIMTARRFTRSQIVKMLVDPARDASPSLEERGSGRPSGRPRGRPRRKDASPSGVGTGGTERDK